MNMMLAFEVFNRAKRHACTMICLIMVTCFLQAWADQTINLNGLAGGRRFDGIGAVSGGGATSVLLKDYPETQRNQILDLLFKPDFGASMSTLLVEVPGDGNSTQGAEPSHMHSRHDLNFGRGYEWWLMSEAKKRNRELTLDACAWGCPGWVGDGSFWSQDMCDYYVKWIQGLKSVYGLDLTAIGCRNEKGVDLEFAKRFRATLNANGLSRVRLHGFDNWGEHKFDWATNLNSDSDLRKSVDILSNHTLFEMPASPEVQLMAADLDKPIWNSEEHIYKKGFDCEISLVQSFNENFIRSGATKIVNWYLVGSVYPMESYSEDPPAIIANSPWSGNYHIREVLWGYAHYGQFSKVGWSYLNGGYGELTGGGSFVTLKSPGRNYSMIFETKDATNNQPLTINLGGGLSVDQLCVWRSDVSAQFVRQPDLKPRNNSFSILLEPRAIYSISTTTGQRKGEFKNVPASHAFPFPYRETFQEYAQPDRYGWLPHYTADIAGIFEIADRPDRPGKCLRQVIGKLPQSWAPEWLPYTILGDRNWKNCTVSADIYLDGGGAAGIMGRVNDVGSGYGCVPKGYYLKISEDGHFGLYGVRQVKDETNGSELASGSIPQFDSKRWHNLKLQFAGNLITGEVDNVTIFSVSNSLYSSGMAGLMAGVNSKQRNTACFDNLLINANGAPQPGPTLFSPDQTPIY